MQEIEFAAPKTVAEATAILGEYGSRARCLAGGTDIIVQLREHRRPDIGMLVDIKAIPEVSEISFTTSEGLKLGAAVPCYRIYEDANVAKAYPGLIDAVTMIGGKLILIRASVGGNLCNGSPAADTIPALISHEGKCVIAGAKGTREVPVEDFCTAPGKTVLQDGEFLVRIDFPPPKPHSAGRYLRFIPRNEMDIAVVGVGVNVQLDDAKQKCIAARVALAAVAPTPLLVPGAGAALVDGTLNDDLVEKAVLEAQASARPISDMRGDSAYRKHLVGVLVRRALQGAIERVRNG